HPPRMKTRSDDSAGHGKVHSVALPLRFSTLSRDLPLITSVLRLTPLFALLLTHAVARAAEDTFPAGSEKAVRAVRELYPDAVLNKVSAPQGFGAGAADGSSLFWVVDLQREGSAQQLKVTPEGVIILLPRTVAENELPQAVSDAMRNEAGGGK